MGDVGSKATSSQHVKRDGQGDVPEIRWVKGSEDLGDVVDKV